MRRETATGPACLLINPRSFLASRNSLWQRAAEAAGKFGAPVRMEADLAGFLSAVSEFSGLGASKIIVFGGDGTLQGLLSECLRAGTLESLPALMKLGGGRTNLIAANLKGTGGDVIGKLERALEAPAGRDRTRTVPTFVVSCDENPIEAGLFLAGAVIDEAIREIHAYREGQHGRWRDGTLASLCWAARRTTSALARLRPFERPEMEIEAQGLGKLQGPMRLMLLSTLDRMPAGIRPYAPHGQGAVRVLAARADASGFWRTVPAIARGRFDRSTSPETGYLSGRCPEVKIDGLHRYCIDGQEFESQSGSVRVRGGPEIRFAEPAP